MHKSASLLLVVSLLFCLILCQSCQSGNSDIEAHRHIQAKRVKVSPRLDGNAFDACWKETDWHPINQLWAGTAYKKADFSGHFKVAWSDDFVYILAEIVDDVLKDSHRDGLQKYWDDDCMEIFIDEDMSGGNHQYNHNAFAYHVGINGNVVDIGTDSLPHYYNSHIITRKTANSTIYTWEMAMNIYDDSFVDNSNRNSPLKLTAGKKMGFAVAYCDNDYSEEREHFIGSVAIEGEDKNRAWIDASLFGSIELVE